MRTLIVLMAAVLLAFPSLPVNAETGADQSAPPTWVPVDNCPAANAMGPRVYQDVEDGAPYAMQELSLLTQTLRVCQNGNAAANAPSQNSASQNAPRQDAPPQNAPPNNGGRPQIGLNTVLQTLGTLEQMLLQYRSGTASGYNGNNSSGSSYSNASSARSTSSSGSSRSTSSSATWSYPVMTQAAYVMRHHSWRH